MTKPNFDFCGYPVVNSESPNLWIACGKVATPGCAYCDQHGMEFSEGSVARPLTADEIVERAEQRKLRAAKTRKAIVKVAGYCLFIVLFMFTFMAMIHLLGAWDRWLTKVLGF